MCRATASSLAEYDEYDIFLIDPASIELVFKRFHIVTVETEYTFSAGCSVSEWPVGGSRGDNPCISGLFVFKKTIIAVNCLYIISIVIFCVRFFNILSLIFFRPK